jgi:uncharacterized protein YkwD
MKIFSYLLVSSALAIAGCGGGGDGGTPSGPSGTAPNTSPNSGTNTVITNAPTLTTQTTSSEAPTNTGSTLVTGANSCNIPNFQADMLRAVNEARAQSRFCGKVRQQVSPAAAVVWDDELFAAAAGHSQDMAQRVYFSHVSLDGRAPGDRVKASGYVFRNLGENIAAGQIGIAAAMKDWLESESGHCEAIMDGTFTEIAVACVTTNRQRYPTYWTMELAKPA